MPRHRLALLALVVRSAFTTIQLSGCTAIGFGVGAAVDQSRGKGTADRLSKVYTGTRATLWLRDGRKLQGRVLGSSDSLSETPPDLQPNLGKQPMAPLRAVLLLDTGQGIQQIPIQDVQRVTVPDARGKFIGVLGGLLLDIFILRGATAEWPG